MGRELRPDDPMPDPGAGFTLIELLVVVAILSTLGLGLSFLALRGGASGAAADMARFQAAWTAEADLAITGQSRRGLDIAGSDLRRAHLAADGWVLSETPERLRQPPVLNANPGPSGAPDIVFLANGRSTPFEIFFPAGNRPTGRCVSTGWTGLSCAF